MISPRAGNPGASKTPVFDDFTFSIFVFFVFFIFWYFFDWWILEQMVNCQISTVIKSSLTVAKSSQTVVKSSQTVIKVHNRRMVTNLILRNMIAQVHDEIARVLSVT